MRAILIVVALWNLGCAADASDPTSCTLPADLGVLDGAAAEVSRAGAGVIRVSLPLDGAGRDRFTLELYQVAPGDHAIAGAELDLETCRICATVEANLHEDSAGRFLLAQDYYFARAGAVRLESRGGHLVADLANVELATRMGDCATRIDSLSVDL